MKMNAGALFLGIIAAQAAQANAIKTLVYTIDYTKLAG